MPYLISLATLTDISEPINKIYPKLWMWLVKEIWIRSTRVFLDLTRRKIMREIIPFKDLVTLPKILPKLKLNCPKIERRKILNKINSIKKLIK